MKGYPIKVQNQPESKF
jgi:hypothetical protein